MTVRLNLKELYSSKQKSLDCIFNTGLSGDAMCKRLFKFWSLHFIGTLTSAALLVSLVSCSGSDPQEPPVDRPPTCPGDPVPAHQATEIPYRDVSFQWTGGDPDGDAVQYDFYIGYGTDHLFLFGKDLESPLYHFDELDRETTFYWQVIAKNFEHIVRGPIWTFRTNDEE